MKELIVITFTKEELKEMIKEVVVGALLERKDTVLPNNIEKPMTVKDVSEYLDLAVQTIYGLTSQNIIPHLKRGKRVYFIRTEIINWLNKGKTKTLDDIDKEAEDYINRKRMES